MNQEQGRTFLRALGVQSKIQKSGKWLQCSCPLASRKHQNAKDSNPSFGLFISDDKPAFYNCYACSSGSALDLLQGMEYLKIPGDYAKAREVLEAEELAVSPLPAYLEFNLPEDFWLFKPWPELWLSQFSPAWEVQRPREYLLGRDVTVEEQQKYDLRWDIMRQMVVFPLREANGQLAGARGRSVLPDVSGPDKHYDYSHDDVPKNVKGVWWNEPALHLPGPVVVVEGQFDAMRVLKVWPKTLGNLTARPTTWKCSKLAYCPRVVHIPDNDLGGEQSIAAYAETLNKMGIKYRTLMLPAGVKDPGDCHPQYLLDRITEAVAEVS